MEHNIRNTNFIEEETTKPEMNANRDESVTQSTKSKTEKSKNNMKFALYGIGAVGVLAISTIVAKFTGVFNPSPVNHNVNNTAIEAPQSFEAFQEAQKMENYGTQDAREVSEHMPLLEASRNTAYAKNDNNLYYDENAVGNAIQSNGILEFDAAATENTIKEELPKPKQMTMEEKLMQKPLNQLSNEELMMAYQLVDQQLAKDTESHFALLHRMKELGIKAPVSQLEARQLQREKRLVEETTRMITNKFSTDLQLLAQRMEELNANQIKLSRNISTELSRVMQRIDVEEINSRKVKQQQNELTKANKGLLNRYRITQILGGRVWISTDNKNAKTYVVGDRLADNVIITGIDVDKKSVSTNKGIIQ